MLSSQEKGQKKYFDKKFGSVKKYELLPWRRSYIRRIKESLLGISYKDKVLLDIGTGAGYVAIEMAKLGLRVIACDLSTESIDNLRGYKKIFRLKNLRAIACSANRIPLADKSVDYIVANAIIEHLEDDKGAIREWKRILKSGGRMLITTDLSLHYAWPFFWPIYMVHDKQIGHLRRYNLDSLKRKVGLSVERVYYTGHFIKMLWFLFSMALKSLEKFAAQIEEIDSKNEEIRYGSSNIIVVFKK